jgi:hypothetical protein
VNVGDLVMATDGPFMGLMGLITHMPSHESYWGRGFYELATVMWRNGNHQRDVSTKYLEIVK